MKQRTFTIWVVDDEETIRDGVALHLQSRYRIDTFADAESAIAGLGRNRPDLILLDIGLPGMDGIEALERFKEFDPHIPVIMITAYEDVDTVVAAMKRGAHDYVVKPIHMDGLGVSIANGLETVRLRAEVSLLQETYLKENLPFFVGESEEMQAVMDLVASVARSPDTPILIIGETGTGKELIASAIHYRSPNFKGPLVTVNCAAIPPNLVESELFGYEKGAFSGAKATGKRGLVEEAAKGTLFLDEVGDLSLEAQATLLRFLEEGEFYRVGGTRPVHIETRVISATNRDIGTMIEGESFRTDLFYRLGVVQITVPSLNERRDDIIPLATYFLNQFNEKFEKQVTRLSGEAIDTLLAHSWSGNIRELKNCIERGVLTCRGNILEPVHLGLAAHEVPAARVRAPAGLDLPAVTHDGIDFETLRRTFERFYIDAALRLAGGNESKAARLLGLNHHTFRYRKKKLDESS